MSRIISVLSLLLFFISCTKKEENKIFWEKSFGKGTAYSIVATTDSGFITCGQIINSPYFLKLDRSGKKVIDYTSENEGMYSSVLIDANGYFLGGSSSGKMLLTRLDSTGTKVWEKTVNSTTPLFKTILLKTSGGSFMGVGTADADSSQNLPAGLMFVWFDTSGIITSQRVITQGSFIAANDVTVDNSGNIYLAVTKKETGSHSKATVTKWSSSLQKFWETELYNNPDFGAASLGLEIDNSGNIYVSGHTELPSDNKVTYNSFVVKLDNTGIVKWKKYLESYNTGSEVILDKNGDIMMLNRNCFVVNILASADGSNIGKLRILDACDSNNTDAFGCDVSLNAENNLLLSGSKGNSYYVAVKPAANN